MSLSSTSEDSVTAVLKSSAEDLRKLLELSVEGVPVTHLIIEVSLILALIITVLWPKKKSHGSNDDLTKEDQEKLLREWDPVALVTPVEDKPEWALGNYIAEGVVSTHVQIDGVSKLNLSSFNFLGMVENEEVKNVGIAAARRYGIGSCGPRGFYGTIDCHLDLERDLQEFMGVEEAILYSYGFSTIASVIPAYSKRGDVIFFDKGVSFAIQKGLIASRSKLVPFEHNDMDDLQRCLETQEEQDKKDTSKAQATRRFLVVEGLYEYYGDVCPLDRLVELKYKYKVRLFVEETMSFGVLGATGRGVTEHFGISPRKIDCIAAGLSNALGSIGGFACGSSFVIDHQRLAGAGYCYSASLPPLLAVTASKALALILTHDGALQAALAKNARALLAGVAKIKGLDAVAEPGSPIIHLRLSEATVDSNAYSRREQVELLVNIAREAADGGVVCSLPEYVMEEELYPPPPSLRLTVSAKHKATDLKKAATTLSKAAKKYL